MMGMNTSASYFPGQLVAHFLKLRSIGFGAPLALIGYAGFMPTHYARTTGAAAGEYS
jgi:hypothetical protein